MRRLLPLFAIALSPTAFAAGPTTPPASPAPNPAPDAPQNAPGKARPAPPTLRVPFERYRLGNGLVVILAEDHRTPRVAVNLLYRVGSKDERPGRTGFAHLFEHLMFMGTRRVPNGQFDSIMEAEGGTNNATTSEDRTDYFAAGPAHLLETFLWLEADRLASLPDDMTKDKVDLQRDVVKNERRQSYENRPYGKVDLILPERMYPAGHPYHHPVIGSHEDLTAASVDDVKQFFREFYLPGNASLVIAGDFQPAEAKKLVEKYFASLSDARVPRLPAPAPAALAAPVHVELTDAVELPKVVLVWHSPAEFLPGDAACDLLAAVLGGGKSSRLYRALVYDRKIAQEVHVEQLGQMHGGLFVIEVLGQPGAGAADLERAVDEELARLGPSSVTEDELERARAVTQTHLLREAERVDEMAYLLNLFEMHFGDPGQLTKRLLAQFDEVTVEGIAAQVQGVLGRPRLTVLVSPQTPAAAPVSKGDSKNAQKAASGAQGAAKKARGAAKKARGAAKPAAVAAPAKGGAK